MPKKVNPWYSLNLFKVTKFKLEHSALIYTKIQHHRSSPAMNIWVPSNKISRRSIIYSLPTAALYSMNIYSAIKINYQISLDIIILPSVCILHTSMLLSTKPKLNTSQKPVDIEKKQQPQ